MSKFSEYATTSALSSAVSNITSTISSLDYLSVGALSSATIIPDITGLASESWVSANFLSSGTLSGYATETYVQNELSDYAKTSDLSVYALESELSSYATVSALNSSISGLSSIYASASRLNDYAELSQQA